MSDKDIQKEADLDNCYKIYLEIEECFKKQQNQELSNEAIIEKCSVCYNSKTKKLSFLKDRIKALSVCVQEQYVNKVLKP